MWYITAGILLATIVLVDSLLIFLKGSFPGFTNPGDWLTRPMLIPVNLLLAAVLYFVVVKDSQDKDTEDVAKRAAIAGAIVYAVLGALYGLSLVLSTKDLRVILALPFKLDEFLLYVGEGAALSFVAAGTAVSLSKLL